MATLGELLLEITDTIQDPSFTNTKLTALVNRAVREISGTIPAPLPYLETVGPVTTSTVANYVALPTTYQRDFDFCFSAAQSDEVPRYASLEYLRELDPSMSQAGLIRAVTISGPNLYYVDRPGVADVLTLHYYRMPTLLTSETSATDTGTPLCIPTHLHEKLLVNRACEIVFSRIEDGIDGQKVNTNYHGGQYKEALNELIYYIGPKKRRAVPVYDIASGYFV